MGQRQATSCARAVDDMCAKSRTGLPQARRSRPSRHGHGKGRSVPWKSPFWCAWLVVSLLLSAFMTVEMPTQKPAQPTSMSTKTKRMDTARVEATVSARNLGARDPDARNQDAAHLEESVEGPANEPAIEPASEPSRGLARAPASRKGSPNSAPDVASGVASGTAPEAARNPGTSAHNADRADPAYTPSPAMGQGRGKAMHNESEAVDRLLHRARIFARLFVFVALGAILGAVIEGRCWYRFLAGTLGRLTRAARLPHMVGAAMPTALASCPAADSMLVASHARGEISRTALVAGGMLNSYLAHLSHSMRVLYPVVAAIGLPGLLYFVIQFSGGALILAVVLVLHRMAAQRRSPDASDGTGSTNAPADATADVAAFHALEHQVLGYGESLKKGVFRAATLLFRIACISVPMMLAMEWCIRAGLLDFWPELVPEAVSRHFPQELLAITAAQMGGLVQSSTVSASLLSQNLITQAQVLLAMLVSSAVGNPIRALRRNLPTALGIFTPGTALLVVCGMQFSRLVVTLAGAALVIAWMHMTG